MVKLDDSNRNKYFKANILLWFSVCLISVLICRLFYLQVLKHKSYTQRAQYSTSRISIKTAPRGNIYDRNGKIIATNKQSISLVAYPNKINSKKKKEKTYRLLSKIIEKDLSKLKKDISKLPKNAPLPIRLRSNLSVKEATLIVENKHLLEGVDIQEEPIRFYPHGNLAAHVIGYISQISERELSKRPDRKLGDLVGKDGIEKIYDDILRGNDGKKIVEVDRYGKPIDPNYKHAIIDIEPEPGRNIYLTLDIELQRALQNALEESMATAAAVAVNATTGEVLAIGSHPTFDPNIFTRPIPSNLWNKLVSEKAFLNRAILSYVPGSIWKPITLIAGLDAMVIKPDEKFRVSEAVYLGSTRFGDWTGKAGVYSLQMSLAWSRDTAFYQIAQRLKPEQIKDWGVKLGAGRRTGIELLGEEKGIVPDNEWKQKNLGEPWYPGNTLHYSIGQSFLLVTPTQAARIYSAIANGNKVPKLKLVKTINKDVKRVEVEEKYKLDPVYLKVVQDGLEECVASGTGGACRLEEVKVAGKTGSAEVPGSRKTHSWFASYAPVNNPELVVIAFAEKAGHGGTVAAPIARKVISNYFGIEDKIYYAPPPVENKPKKKKRRGFFRRIRT